jgi:DnaJ-class molecular chaperone
MIEHNDTVHTLEDREDARPDAPETERRCEACHGNGRTCCGLCRACAGRGVMLETDGAA